MANFLDEHGLSVVWERIKELIDKKILKGLADKLDKQNSKGTGYIAYNPYNSNNIGDYASVLGYHCDSTSRYAHSEGYGCTASASAAHAEGYNTTASGAYSHAEGYENTASSSYSHAEGYHTTAKSTYQHVQGKFNVLDSSSTYADIIGWGTSTSSSGRKNIEATTTTGDKRLKGDVYVHCNDDSTGGNKLLANNDIVVEYKSTTGVSVAANAIAQFSIDVTKDGYTPLGIVGRYIGYAPFSFVRESISNNTASVTVRNVTSSATNTGTVGIYVLYIKN